MQIVTSSTKRLFWIRSLIPLQQEVALMDVAKGVRPSSLLARPRSHGTFLFQSMQHEPHALNKLDIRFRWGGYGIQVLWCHLHTFYAGEVAPAHQHCDYEFHFIPAGKGIVMLEDDTFLVGAGMFYLTGPYVTHQQVADLQEPWQELCLHVAIAELENDMRNEHTWGEQWAYAEADACIRHLKIIPASPIPDQYDAMSCFLTAYTAWQDREFGAYNTIQQAIIQILMRAVRAHDATQIHTALPPRDMNAYRYRLATQYIRDNYARTLTLDEVARSLHIGGRQLQRILSDQAGETFSSYLEHHRLGQVCLALTRTDQTVEQLAIQHGFSSGSYLHHIFKRRLGMTPLHYRQQRSGTSTEPEKLLHHVSMIK